MVKFGQSFSLEASLGFKKRTKKKKKEEEKTLPAVRNMGSRKSTLFYRFHCCLVLIGRPIGLLAIFSLTIYDSSTLSWPI